MRLHVNLCSETGIIVFGGRQKRVGFNSSVNSSDTFSQKARGVRLQYSADRISFGGEGDRF